MTGSLLLVLPRGPACHAAAALVRYGPLNAARGREQQRLAECMICASQGVQHVCGMPAHNICL